MKTPVETAADESISPQHAAEPSGAREAWRKFWNVAAGFLITFALFAVAEMATRIHHHYYARDAYSTYQPRHLVDFTRFYRVNPEFRSKHVQTNSAGFRNAEEIAPEKPDDVIRVVTMGGSTVWGAPSGPPFPQMVPNDHTIAAHLETILNEIAAERELDVTVQVLNAGVVGYRMYQNLTYFNNQIADFAPDVVIAMDGHNDLDALQLGIGPFTHRNEAPSERAANDPTFVDLLGQIMKYVGRRSLFFRKVHGRLAQRATERARRANSYLGQFERPPTAAEIETWLHYYETTVRRLDASARIAGARVLFTVQPEIAGERHKSLHPVEIAVRDYWQYYSHLHTVVRNQLIERMGEIQREHGVWFEDVSDVFAQEPEQVYLDYTHLSNLGAEIMARRLAALVESEVFRSTTTARGTASLKNRGKEGVAAPRSRAPSDSGRAPEIGP